STTGGSGQFTSLVVDPATAGTSNSVILGTTRFNNAGVVRSTDADVSWKPTLASGSAYSLIAHPTETGTYYVGDDPASPVVSRGVYRSTDVGATWTMLPALPVADANDVGRIELAVSKKTPNLLWALVGNRTTGGF